MEILNPLSIARGNRLYEPAGRVKSGVVIAGSFSGTPKKATVTFITAFPTTDYAVTFDVVSVNYRYAPTAENKTASGFDLNLGSNMLSGLAEVGWLAVQVGE